MAGRKKTNLIFLRRGKNQFGFLEGKKKWINFFLREKKKNLIFNKNKRMKRKWEKTMGKGWKDTCYGEGMYFKGLNQIMWRIRIIVDRNKRNKVLKLRNYYKNNSKNNHIPSTPSFSYIKLLFLTIICCYSSLFHFISSYFLFSLNTFLFLFKITSFPFVFLSFYTFSCSF